MTERLHDYKVASFQGSRVPSLHDAKCARVLGERSFGEVSVSERWEAVSLREKEKLEKHEIRQSDNLFVESKYCW